MIRLKMKKSNMVLTNIILLSHSKQQISPLSSSKIDKYEYVTLDKILPSNQRQTIKQAKLTYSPSVEAFKKQTKAIEEQGEKKIKALENSVEKLF